MPPNVPPHRARYPGFSGGTHGPRMGRHVPDVACGGFATFSPVERLQLRTAREREASQQRQHREDDQEGQQREQPVAHAVAEPDALGP